jgi:hypothetical protein
MLPGFEWSPVRGGLSGNADFEAAAAEARDQNSAWMEALTVGKLGETNAVRAEAAKQARCFMHISVSVASLPLSPVWNFRTIISFLLTAPRCKAGRVRRRIVEVLWPIVLIRNFEHDGSRIFEVLRPIVPIWDIERPRHRCSGEKEIFWASWRLLRPGERKTAGAAPPHNAPPLQIFGIVLWRAS